jgi:tRNA (guanine-N7-)-methyltransferase
MLELIGEAPGFVNLADDYVPRPEFRPLTKFELRGERLGHGVWDIMAQRTQ